MHTHTHQRENEDIQDIPVNVRAYKPSELTHVIALTKPAKTMKKSKHFHQSLRYACLCITKPRATTFMSISSVNICMKKSYCNQEYLYEESILHQDRLQIWDIAHQPVGLENTNALYLCSTATLECKIKQKDTDEAEPLWRRLRQYPTIHVLPASSCSVQIALPCTAAACMHNPALAHHDWRPLRSSMNIRVGPKSALECWRWWGTRWSRRSPATLWSW